MTRTKALALIAFLLLPASTGMAAAEPASVDDCLKQLDVLVAEAEAADLLDDQIDLAEIALGKMERQCVASHFGEAMAAAGEVHKLLATNK